MKLTNLAEQPVKVAAVSYLNTKPLLYGLTHHPVARKILLSLDYPSKIADQLIRGDVDLALVPVAILPRLRSYQIVGDYCIGADGPVASVGLFSEVPLDQIRQVYLDYQSRTSVALLKLLCAGFWKINPGFLETDGEFPNRIRGTDAGLLIGDRALAQRTRSPYCYDLGEAWKSFTGLPFVFAAWISTRVLPLDFVQAFNAANQLGLEHIEEVVRENPCPWIDLNTYFTRHISYLLTPEKRKGLEKFLELLSREDATQQGLS